LEQAANQKTAGLRIAGLFKAVKERFSFISMKNNRFGGLLMFFSSICACGGQLFWKLALGERYWINLFVGFCLYGLGSCMMLVAYKSGKLSVLQPILGLNYIFAILAGYFVFCEAFTIQKIIGIAVIGISVITVRDNED
jgi:undecaprenyl phosphate-alpha-L-ara4N flippase subunit ArnE